MGLHKRDKFGRFNVLTMWKSLMVLSFLIGTQATAGYINNSKQWENLPETFQQGFVAGVFTELTMPMTTDDTKTSKWKASIVNCVLDSDFNIKDFVVLVDMFYRDLENRNIPTNIALRFSLQNVCFVEY